MGAGTRLTLLVLYLNFLLHFKYLFCGGRGLLNLGKNLPCQSGSQVSELLSSPVTPQPSVKGPWRGSLAQLTQGPAEQDPGAKGSVQTRPRRKASRALSSPGLTSFPLPCLTA